MPYRRPLSRRRKRNKKARAQILHHMRKRNELKNVADTLPIPSPSDAKNIEFGEDKKLVGHISNSSLSDLVKLETKDRDTDLSEKRKPCRKPPSRIGKRNKRALAQKLRYMRKRNELKNEADTLPIPSTSHAKHIDFGEDPKLVGHISYSSLSDLMKLETVRINDLKTKHRDSDLSEKFPTDPEMKEKWRAVMDMPKISKYTSICSRHFTDDCYTETKKRRILKKSAVPSFTEPISITKLKTGLYAKLKLNAVSSPLENDVEENVVKTEHIHIKEEHDLHQEFNIKEELQLPEETTQTHENLESEIRQIDTSTMEENITIKEEKEDSDNNCDMQQTLFFSEIPKDGQEAVAKEELNEEHAKDFQEAFVKEELYEERTKDFQEAVAKEELYEEHAKDFQKAVVKEELHEEHAKEFPKGIFKKVDINDILKQEVTNSTDELEHFKATAVAGNRKRNYRCDNCRRTLSRKSSLLVHARSNFGGKPYECEVCCKTFIQKVHSTGDIYHCDVCDKGFMLKRSLVLHRRRHV